MKTKTKMGKSHFFSLLILLSLLTLSGCELINSSSVNSNTFYLNGNSFVEEDYFVEHNFPAHLNTPPIYIRGTIQVLFTVLSVSHLNVSFDGTQGEGHIWSPNPENFTLQKGEQYSENFTLIQGIESCGRIFYVAFLTELNSNATVRFSYKIINDGSKPAFLPFGTILLSLITFSLFIRFHRKFGKKQ